MFLAGGLLENPLLGDPYPLLGDPYPLLGDPYPLLGDAFAPGYGVFRVSWPRDFLLIPAWTVSVLC